MNTPDGQTATEILAKAPGVGDAQPAGGPETRARTGVRAIALLEGLKGLLALAGAGGLYLAGPVVLQQWLAGLVAAFGLSPGRGITGWLLQRIDAGTVHIAAAVVLAYGLMRLVEAWGLWRARAWASWFGCISAAVYIPLELYALVQRPGWPGVAVLAANLLIVLVLAQDLARRRHGGR